MQRPDQGPGAFAPVNPADTTDEVTDTDQETVGADDVKADAVRSGADEQTAPAGSDTDRGGLGWDDDEGVLDPDRETVGRDDARADAARSGADPEQV